MAGEIEAAGELVSGALLGRAFEPNAGEGHGAHGLCLNCGTTLIGPHCYRCGQTGHVHRTLGGMAHEIVHGVFHFDGKFFRTLPLLVWRRVVSRSHAEISAAHARIRIPSLMHCSGAIQRPGQCDF